MDNQASTSSVTQVLVVEDDENSRLLLGSVLTNHGFIVRTAVDGLDALEILKDLTPHLIVSDILMPNIDGYSLCRQVKKIPRLQATRFVFYSATYTDQRDQDLAYSIGADLFLVKPMDISNLVLALEDLLESGPNGKTLLLTDEMMSLLHGERVHAKLIKKITELELAREELSQTLKALNTSNEELLIASNYDPLTNLPNRRLLNDRLHHVMAMSQRSKTYGAVLFVDIDNFKTLNDTKGHELGDSLLRDVSTRLTSCLRLEDSIARLGGDEFIVVISGLSDDLADAETQAQQMGEKLCRILLQPFDLNGYEYHCSASVGACLFLGFEVPREELLKHADTAMYEAKKAGRNTVRVFDPVMQKGLENRVMLEKAMRNALGRQYLLHYQPQFNEQGVIVGAEALIRWMHDERGLIPPADFIPFAEETGLITSIGLWVLETACYQLGEWSKGNSLARNLSLAVNVSTKQFNHPDFVKQMESIFLKTQINPRLLKLELTETVVMVDIADTITKMHAFRNMGIEFSLDDFGTGHSSLSYLTQLPLTQLKIDKSFVHNIGLHTKDAVIVETIIAMGKTLGLDVIAEGVETEAQHAFLCAHGCNMFQGYLFSSPVPLDAFEELLAKNKTI